MIKRILLLATAMLLGVSLWAQKSDEAMLRNRLTNYFTTYTNASISNADVVKIKNISINQAKRSVAIYVSESFAAQPFTSETISRIRQDVIALLPPPYNTYQLSIYANGAPIEELAPCEWDDSARVARRWGKINYRGNAWVTPASLQFTPSRGLQGRHLALWASHGNFYDIKKETWRWQRPRLYCTSEDLLTQSFVVPFLMPMLENAGACLFTPRERDMQRNEVIVDNDYPQLQGKYTETNGANEWRTEGQGFLKTQDVYFDKTNPFDAGTARMVDAQQSKRQSSSASWEPIITEEGDYAVYVSYRSLPNSITDARYEVHHCGITSVFHVNQRMGGSTWVYLGTFHFRANDTANNYITLSNVSNYRGVVSADAVRLGGGMGNVARSTGVFSPVRSGLPRYLEGARYSAQWYGMPYSIYSTKESENDYADDINVRSLTTNYVAGGSCYLPNDTGLHVPLELCLAVHSDAGLRGDSTLIGTLGLYTTGKYTTTGSYDGPLAQGMLPSGITRLTSRNMAEAIMTQVTDDMTKLCGAWTRRQLYDRNYSECRNPEIPSMILEMFSHQNWFDMCHAHDPWFKFHFSRAIYKGVLRYVAAMHQAEEPVVQPLPVRCFASMLNAVGDSVTLSWQATEDALEPSAKPDYYILYTCVGDGDFDNGRRIASTTITLPIQRSTLMRYRVTAVNEGGQSMPSEELCAYSSKRIGTQALLVNNFTRLAGPQPVVNDSLRGFDLKADPGVVYRSNPCYCGYQTDLHRFSFDEESLGHSDNQLEGIYIAGNTMDYPTQYGRDMIATIPELSFSSCSRQYAEQCDAMRNRSKVVILICGAQRNDRYSKTSAPCFSNGIKNFLHTHAINGTSILVSGAYLSEELQQGDEGFCRSVLHCNPDGALPCDSAQVIFGMGAQFNILCRPNEQHYAVGRTSVLSPTSDAFATMLYPLNGASAAVAHQGQVQRTMTFGFPLEIIPEEEVRRGILGASLNFLLTR